MRKLLGITGLGSPAEEAEVTEIQNLLIHNAFKKGQNVYVDDMNLKNAYVARLMGIAEHYGAKVTVHDLTNESLENSIRQDSQREKPVGPSFITDLYNRYVRGKGYPLPMPEKAKVPAGLPPKPYVADTTRPWAILIDIDGTVALHGTAEDPEAIRGHHDYSRVNLDRPNAPVIRAVQSAIDSGFHPVFLSGRPDSCYSLTSEWLETYVGYGAFDYSLHMRRTGDKRPDYIVKNELFDKYVRSEWQIAYALDDRDQVVNMYRAMGLTVMQVAPGNF